MQQAIDILERIKLELSCWIDPNHCTVQFAQTILDQWIRRIQSLWDGWIPVTERLPENSNDILLRWIFWYVNTAIWRYHHTGENWFVLPNTVGFYKTENVTHWMPLPNSPKQ